MNSRILIMAILLATAPVAALGASVYKWTDEDGVTHFGDRQPTGKQAEKVNVRTGKSSNGERQGMSAQEQLEGLQKRQQEQQEQTRESAVEEARRKQREANCEMARSNLEVIQRNARIQVEEEGELRYLSPEEIQEKQQEFQEMKEENCNPPLESDQQ